MDNIVYFCGAKVSLAPFFVIFYAWELRKFSDLCSMFTDGDWIEAKDQSTEGVRLIQTGNVGVTQYLDKPNNAKWISEDTFSRLKCEEIFEGDILISRLPDPAGRACIMPNLGTKMITAVDCTIVRTLPDVNSEYLVQYLSTERYFKEINACLAGGTRQRVSRGNLAEFDIPLPNSSDEQRQIGTYFRNLDHLITLHQRKCETLKKLKKSMLQKMFPKNGSHFPEIRFAGFTDAWEQRKFSDFTFPAGERNKDDLDLEPFAITSNQGFIAQSEAHDDFGYMKDVDRKMYIVVKPNSFAYNPARINVGSLGYYEGAENVIVSSLYEVFQTAEYVDDKFLKHWFKTKAFQDWIERLQEGSVRLYFYYDKLCECIMSMPSVEEQRKIGAYLDKIDNLITLHQRKLETLKKLKKAMLQKMFI